MAPARPVPARRYRALLGLGLLLTPLAVWAEERSGLQWLERMNEALRELDYAGHIVYQYDDRLESMYMLHRVGDDGREHEYLVSLNGPTRQVIRHDRLVSCVLPDAQRTDVVQGAPAAPPPAASPAASPVGAPDFTRHYRLEVAGDMRVAGRDARLLHILPGDALRYGYRLALDAETALPLQSELRTADQQVVSRIMFTDLALGADAVTTAADFELPNEPPAATLGVESPAAELPASWHFVDMPPGFVMHGYRRKHGSAGPQSRQHFLLTDGLARVSVYVEPEHPGVLSGAVQLGSISALAQAHGDHWVTLIGEVPPQTLQRILAGLQPVPAG